MYQLKSLKIKNIISFKEQEFTFRNGKAVLIVGQNLDDLGQAGNGSGKSSLIESISLAFTGTSLRDVKTKELIHNAQESGEVTLVLYNTADSREFVIWRKLYSNTKSAEYRSWLGGVEQLDRYSDQNMFNQFVWETIGISKDDFFSFFLITKENYTPFLIVSDTVKKTIINRFSGADKVDVVFPEIETDSIRLAGEVVVIEKELLQNTTKQELWAEQIAIEEAAVSDEKKVKAVEAKEAEFAALLDKVQPLEDIISNEKSTLYSIQEEFAKFTATEAIVLEPFSEAVELAELEAEAFEYSENYEAKFAEINDIKGNIEGDIFSKKYHLPKIKEAFKAEIDAITLEEKEAKESLADAEKELQVNEKFESDVQKQLHDSIECPNCHHFFNLRDKSFNYVQAKAKLPDVQAAILDYKAIIQETREAINVTIQASKVAVNNKITAAGDTIRKEIEALNGQLIDAGAAELAVKRKLQKENEKKQNLLHDVSQAKAMLANKKSGFGNEKTALSNTMRWAELSLQSRERELKSLHDEITGMEAAIDVLLNQEADCTKINKLKADIAALVIAEEKIKDRLDTKRQEKAGVDAWELNFKSFKSHLANQSLKNLEDYTNLFLENMGSNLSVRIEGYKVLSSKKLKESISTSVFRDGFDAGSYGKFSGGERARIDLCTVIAMQELITLNAGAGKGLDMLLADEILESVDAMGMENIINSLQTLGRTVMLVSQNDINALAGMTITIQKKNKVSTILN